METDLYKSGYRLGITWEEDFKPGGPWMCDCNKCIDKTNENRKEWWAGFDAGTNAQKAT